MTYDECYAKAEDAVRMGIIKYEQLEAYAQHFYDKHRRN